jgi:hypothetical protein
VHLTWKKASWFQTIKEQISREKTLTVIFLHIFFVGENYILPSWTVSKWFYDTFTSTATGATRCGSLFGEGFDLLVVS